MPDAQPNPGQSPWDRVAHHADKLFSALEELSEQGGVVALARSAGWSSRRLKDAEMLLLIARNTIDAELEEIRGPGR